jgi:hypothetical protein
MRNATMSGYGLATVVVGAGEKSGARIQARLAVEHGRQVILTDQVVARNQWAQALLGRLLPDTQDEHDGVTHHEHLDTGVPGTLACGDARGVAGMLTPAALLAVASVMWQAWLP